MMIKIVFPILLLCIFCQNSHAQINNIDTRAASISGANCTSVDALSSFIKKNFATETARIRAIYIWTTHHIDYDVPFFLTMDKRPDNLPLPTIANLLATRKGICQGYSEFFTALCKGVGINAIVIGGYTKHEGKINPISHAWVAASLDNEWYLFDPTWGAGYVKDKQFFRKFNNAFYKVSPASFIKDHMPFDPLYQFLSYPLTHKEFTDAKPAAGKALFHYTDSLKQYSQLSSIQQNAAELRRLEAAGIQNNMLQKRQVFLKRRLQDFTSKNTHEESQKIFTAVIASYNEYIGHINKQFSTINDNDLRQMINSMEQNTKLARSLMLETKPLNEKQNKGKFNSLAEIDRFWEQLRKDKQFTERYFATEPGKRKQLFIKR